MFHAHDGLLQLAVYDNAVCHNDNIIKDDFVVGVMQTGQAVRKPRDSVRFAGTRAVLYQIVL